MEEKTPETQEPLKPREPDGAKGPQNAVDRVYENFRGVPVKYLDIFIGICVAALAAVILVGFLQSRGIL